MLSMKGIEVESRNTFGNTPLINAAYYGQVGAKIEYKSNIDATPLYAACHEGHLLVVDLLINKGADIEDSRFLLVYCRFSKVLLHHHHHHHHHHL